MAEGEDIAVEYTIERIANADPRDRSIPHFTIHARRGNRTGGPLAWVTTEAQARRVARALRRDDDRSDALIPPAARIVARETDRRGWPDVG
jgi:hypothetical protein